MNEGAFTGAGPLSAVECPDTGEGARAEGIGDVHRGVHADAEGHRQRRIENTATATGTPPGTDTPIGPVPPARRSRGQSSPVTVSREGASPSTTADYKVGQEISYTFLIKNTGRRDAHRRASERDEVLGFGRHVDVRLPRRAASLAPGASVTCTAKYTLTQADIDAGKLENTATRRVAAVG